MLETIFKNDFRLLQTKEDEKLRTSRKVITSYKCHNKQVHIHRKMATINLKKKVYYTLKKSSIQNDKNSRRKATDMQEGVQSNIKKNSECQEFNLRAGIKTQLRNASFQVLTTRTEVNKGPYRQEEHRDVEYS